MSSSNVTNLVVSDKLPYTRKVEEPSIGSWVGDRLVVFKRNDRIYFVCKKGHRSSVYLRCLRMINRSCRECINEKSRNLTNEDALRILRNNEE